MSEKTNESDRTSRENEVRQQEELVKVSVIYYNTIDLIFFRRPSSGIVMKLSHTPSL